MAGTTQCFTPVFGQAIRITKVDGCGRPVYGPGGFAVTSSFTDAKLTMNVEAATEIKVKNAADEMCVYDPGKASLKSVTAEITFCQVDPSLVALLNANWPVELDGAGNIIGWRTNTKLGADNGGFALEIWTGVVGDDVCDNPDSQGAWGYILVPFLVGGTPKDVDITNKEVSFAFDATSKFNSKWGVGPYDVFMGADGKTPGPLLAPIAGNEMMLTAVTTVPPPEAKCGVQDLEPSKKLTLTATKDGTNPKLFTFEATNAKGQTATFDYGDGSATENKPVTAEKADATHTYAVTGEQTATATSDGETATTTANPS